MIEPNNTISTRYHLLRRIGIGGYSEVWLAEDTMAGNMQVALKIFAPDKGLDDQGIALFSKEYSLVFNLNHNNLLLPKHFDVANGSPFLVLPYCAAGSVFSKIGIMTETELAKFMQQAASAIEYLHSQEPPIIHQDIKPDNFLIDNQGSYLLSDFGISSKIRRTLTRSMGAQGSTGTMAYMPPEKFAADKQVVKAGDIFSLGVTLYELLTGDLPFGDNGGLTLKAGADVPNLPAEFGSELNELLRRCMAKEPWERPTAETLQRVAQNYLLNGYWQGDMASKSETPIPESQVKQPQRPTQTIESKEEIEIFQGFNGKSGYRYAQSKTVIAQPIYDIANAFSNGRAIVGKKSGLFGKLLYGYIDNKGQEVIPCQFSEAKKFTDDVAFVFYKHWTLVDINGSPIKHFQFAYPKRNFINGLAVLYRGTKQILIDKNGDELTSNTYIEISGYSEGRAIVTIDGFKKRYGYIDTTGREVIEAKFTKASPFKDGRASVVLKGNSFEIDLDGNVIL